MPSSSNALKAMEAAPSRNAWDLRTVAQSMGKRYQQELDSALVSAGIEIAQANTLQTLHVRSGKPINAFEPQAWLAAFLQFFYGDCAPNLDRPMRVSLKHLFKYLLERKELGPSTQHMWKKNPSTWRIDIKTSCEAKTAHFEKLAIIMTKHGHQSRS